MGGIVLWGAVALTTFAPRASQVQGADNPAAEEAKARTRSRPTAAELRARYPFESLADRLKPLARRSTSNRAVVPPLGDVAKARLEHVERRMSGSSSPPNAVRARSLEMLHSAEVEKFISRAGFGLLRVAGDEPSPSYLEYPESPLLAFAEPTARSVDKDSTIRIALPDRDVREEAGGAWTPSLEVLATFHTQDELSFVDLSSLGFVDPLRGVAGFRAHGFQYLPQLMHPGNTWTKDGQETRSERWRIERVELVSLLKSEKPAVYISEHLPRMLDLKDARTRPLSEFERQSLGRLVAGDEVVAEARLNEIDMFGALRAAKQCLDCHTGQRGDLLGAFSYRLFRDPPVKAAAASLN